MTPDLSTPEKFRAEHQEAHTRLQNYIEMDRSNGVRLRWGVRGELSFHRKSWMTANNLLARIRYAHRFQEALLEVPSLHRGQQYFFVTYTSRRFAVAYDPGAYFETASLKRSLVAVLKRLGVHWAGMIEAGFITRLAMNLPQDGSRPISWHAHVIVWGVGERTLRAALSQLSLETDLAGRSAIHIQRRHLSEAPRQSLYICKFPLAGMMIVGAEGETADWKTGELRPADKWLKKDALRTGDLARAAVVLRDRGVDQLMTSGGDGRQVYQAVQQLVPAKFRDAC